MPLGGSWALGHSVEDWCRAMVSRGFAATPLWGDAETEPEYVGDEWVGRAALSVITVDVWRRGRELFATAGHRTIDGVLVS